MKKIMNSIFFGSLFIAAILIEAYSIQILDGNLFSTVGLGIVVLITGYLFMDSIRSFVEQRSDQAKFYMDRALSEENEKWSERYTELLNLQKANYTAIKKNTAMLTEQFEDLQTRLEALENDQTKALQKVLELQKKSLEGQKNALNLEISYNKENTKRLMGMLREEENQTAEQITKILTLLEKNNELLQSKISISDNTEEQDNHITQNLYQEDFYQDLDMADHIEDELKEDENTSETGWSMEDEPESEADASFDPEQSEQTITPLYDDPNKALTADEIAALFAAYGK